MKTSVGVLVIRGLIASMTPEGQEKTNAAYAKLKAVVDEDGDEATIALALLGAELAEN